jgi:hypothetical protein
MPAPHFDFHAEDSDMPKAVSDVDSLRDYLGGVVARADHHAGPVNEVALAIAGAVIWRKDDTPIEVMARDGEMKNVLWFKSNGARYVLSYNHDAASIELRQGSTQGAVLASFTNNTPNSEVRRVFGML